MKRQWWAVAALAWAGVVAVVALVAWWVIDGAGEDVLAEPASEVVTQAPAGSVPTEPGTDRPDRTDGPTDPTDSPGPTGSSGPTGSTGPAEPTDPSTSSAAPPPPPPPPDTESAPVRRTSSWQGEAGLLRVSCTGADLRLEGASPNDGWVVDKNEKKSDSELEVRFESADGDRRVEIEARCVNGVPDLQVEFDD